MLLLVAVTYQVVEDIHHLDEDKDNQQLHQRRQSKRIAMMDVHQIGHILDGAILCNVLNDIHGLCFYCFFMLITVPLPSMISMGCPSATSGVNVRLVHSVSVQM